MLKQLQWLVILSLPFTALVGLEMLGELAKNLSTYLYLLLIPLAFLHTKSSPLSSKILGAFLVILFCVIAISLLANIEHMMTASFRGRSALNKFSTSTMVVIFGFLISYASMISIKDIQRDLVRPIFWGVVVCVIIAIPEVLSWYSSAVGTIFEPISALLHRNVEVYSHFERLRSVAGEPSFLALYLGFAMVWLLAAQRLKSSYKLFYRIALFSCFAMVALSASRTGYVLVAGIVTIDLITYRLLSSKMPGVLGVLRPLSGYYIVGLLLLIALVSFNYETLTRYVIAGDNVSNLSRFASNTAAFTVFSEHPIFGGGFGQYAFHAARIMPQWAYYSYEITDWFTNPDAVWPPSFTMFGRLGSELGILGLLCWYGFWLWLLSKVIRETIQHRIATGATPVIGNAMMSGILYVLLSGVAYDSFGLPEIWIQLALCCLYLRKRLPEVSHA